MAAYEFTVDWFSKRHPFWPKFPEPLPALNVLEIGSHEGRSAIWMLENLLTHCESKITCVDHWKNLDIEQRFIRNIFLSGQAHKVRKVKDDHWRALTKLPYGYDLIYIDGSHEAKDVLEDAVWAFRLCSPGGYLIFDDYEWAERTAKVPPKPAIDGFLAAYAPRIELIHKEWQVIVRKK